MLQRVGVSEQAAFGIALETLGGLIGVDDLGELPGFVFVAGDAACGVGDFLQAATRVVLPGGGLAGAVGVAGELAGCVVAELLLPTLGVGDFGEQAGLVVAVFGLVAQRVNLFGEVAPGVVVALPEAAFCIADFDELVVGIVGIVDGAVVSADVLDEVAAFVVGEAVDAAIGVDMLDDVLGVVTEKPFRAAIGVFDAVGVAEDVVVVTGLVAERVSDVGEADVLVPFQAGVEAAVVGPFADGFGMWAFAVPLQVHASASAVGVAGDEVVLVRVVPMGGILVLGHDEVARFVVGVARELADQLAVFYLPVFGDAASIIQSNADVGECGLALVGDDVRQDGAFTDAVIVVQGDTGSAAQGDAGQAEGLAVTLIGFLAFKAVGERQSMFRNADERDALDGVVMEPANFG
ncbi:hypothetical protein LMG19083_05039 [Ralstonia psammae]|uniref:Uncharacterized protein n=1 Tax=Ralstonia psammae TaxID=3058598 RepID=A0ABN9JF67_9RALS|nr:hypothetical protein LMG19083_05039 [Ralstonia sp. LMG 19083]